MPLNLKLGIIQDFCLSTSASITVCISVCLAVYLFAGQTNCRTIIIHVYSNSYTFLNLTDISYLPKMKVTVIERHVLLVKVNIIIDVGFKILFRVLYRSPIKLCCKNCNFSLWIICKKGRRVLVWECHI